MASQIPRKASSLKSSKKKTLPQPRTVNEWLEAKLKYPHTFVTNKDGNLVVPPNTAGSTETILEIKPEVPASASYIQEFFKKRLESLKEPEELYTVAKRNLQQTMSLYKSGQATVSDVLDANQIVQDEERKLITVAKFPREMEEGIKGIIESTLTLNPYDNRTVAEGVNYVRYATFPWQAFWMQPEVAESIELQEAQQALLESQQVPENGTAPKRNYTPRQLAIMRARSKAKSSASSGS
jgi:hypothetical protein